MKYAERVAYNLKGCEAVSTGVCPGCDECREANPDYRVTDDDTQEVPTWSFRAANGRTWPTEAEAEAASRDAFNSGWRDCTVDWGWGVDEFSYAECDACGARLGGSREVLHWVDLCTGRIVHSSPGVCADCVAYLANGTLPEESQE